MNALKKSASIMLALIVLGLIKVGLDRYELGSRSISQASTQDINRLTVLINTNRLRYACRVNGPGLRVIARSGVTFGCVRQ